MVIIFGNNACPQCKLVKKYCDDNRIGNKYINIDDIDDENKNAYDKIKIITKAHINGGLPLIQHLDKYAGFSNFKEKFKEWQLI